MSDRPRQAIVAGLTFFLVLALPGDLTSIVLGLTHPNPVATWKLSLGLSLKTVMSVWAIVGLARNQTLGYSALLVASLQIALIRVGDFSAVWGSLAEYWRQVVLSGADLVFRAICIIFWVSRRGGVLWAKSTDSRSSN